MAISVPLTKYGHQCTPYKIWLSCRWAVGAGHHSTALAMRMCGSGRGHAHSAQEDDYELSPHLPPQSRTQLILISCVRDWRGVSISYRLCGAHIDIHHQAGCWIVSSHCLLHLQGNIISTHATFIALCLWLLWSLSLSLQSCISWLIRWDFWIFLDHTGLFLVYPGVILNYQVLCHLVDIMYNIKLLSIKPMPLSSIL